MTDPQFFHVESNYASEAPKTLEEQERMAKSWIKAGKRALDSRYITGPLSFEVEERQVVENTLRHWHSQLDKIQIAINMRPYEKQISDSKHLAELVLIFFTKEEFNLAEEQETKGELIALAKEIESE